GRPGPVRRRRRTRPRRGPRGQRTPTRLPSAIPCRPRRRTVRCELAPAEQPRPLEPRPRRPSGQAYRIQGRLSLLATFTLPRLERGPLALVPEGRRGAWPGHPLHSANSHPCATFSRLYHPSARRTPLDPEDHDLAVAICTGRRQDPQRGYPPRSPRELRGLFPDLDVQLGLGASDFLEH